MKLTAVLCRLFGHKWTVFNDNGVVVWKHCSRCGERGKIRAEDMDSHSLRYTGY